MQVSLQACMSAANLTGNKKQGKQYGLRLRPTHHWSSKHVQHTKYLQTKAGSGSVFTLLIDRMPAAESSMQ